MGTRVHKSFLAGTHLAMDKLLRFSRPLVCDSDHSKYGDAWRKLINMARVWTHFVSFLLLLANCAFALDPSLDISQYAHTAWKVRDGFAKGFFYSIAQTPDGYLWLGTEFGLLRFDGVRAVPWQPPTGQQLPGRDIPTLLVTQDGALWIGTFDGLARWNDGKLTTYPELRGHRISSLLQDREGTVWIGAKDGGKLCGFLSEKMQCQGGFGSEVRSLYEDPQGNLFVGVSDGFWRWKPSPSEFFHLPGPLDGPNFGDYEQTLLIGTQTGVQGLVKGRVAQLPLPGLSQRFRAYRILRDRDGGLWIGTLDRGLVHYHQGKTDAFLEADGLSGDSVVALFEDREGNVWAATPNGLDRFRNYAVPNIGLKQGLSHTNTLSILALKDGSILIGTYNGLNRWENGHISRFGGTLNGLTYSIFQDSSGRIWLSTLSNYGYLEGNRFIPVLDLRGGWAFSVAEVSSGHLWVSVDQGGGLFHLFRGKVFQNISWTALGHKDHARVLLADPSHDGVWLGFTAGGVAFFGNGRIQRSYSMTDGLGRGRVNALRFGERGALWVATEGGLSLIKDGRVTTLSSNNGLPCDTIHWSMEDDAHALWLYTACGLVQVARPELDSWVADPGRRVKTALFDASDGVRSHAYPTEVHGLTKSSDGKIWFIAYDGVSVIDPRRIERNSVPPPVHIERITADGKTYDASDGLRLRPHVRDLTIDFVALSLVAPEKNRYRFKLEGWDGDWRDAVTELRLEYTNLPPKHYRCRVIACNNSGLWNEEGASLDFVIPPAWYQTNWFRAACVAVFFAMLWGIYELRVRQLAHQFNMRLEERVAERTRIARDLHDTLLQSFQALLPLFQVGIRKLPEGAVDSRKTLELALDRASEAIGEGRDAIKGLRVSTIEKNDLALAIRIIAEEFAASENGQNSVSFQLLVEGTSRELHPILRDEIYRLATEALRNAFRHADAKNVEVEIRYDEKYFRLRIRDDGIGIPSDVLSQEGREGHYGLPGMRERAKLVGGELTIWTERDSGTEIELVIPGAKAYVKSPRPLWHFGTRSAAETEEQERIRRE